MSTVSNAASVFSPNQINTTSSNSSSSTSSTAQAAGANASQQLAGNFNTFLQLLTTHICREQLDTARLKNKDEIAAAKVGLSRV